MKVSDYDFELPERCIAQTPAEPRDSARLLRHRISSNDTAHVSVRDLPGQLAPGDLLVLNDARVLPARLHARRGSGGFVELLLAEPLAHDRWRALVKPARKLQPDERLTIEGSALSVRAVEREADEEGRPGAIWVVALETEGGGVDEAIEASGRMPLPPYIRRNRGGDARDALDRERYQTVYARTPGAVAAPTAGLHFTPELLRRLAEAGVEVTTVSLLVGLGTFLPIAVEDTRDHRMHSERIVLGDEAVRAVDRCRERGGRVVAVGTTSVRVLEACADPDGRLTPGEGATDLFIEPGYGYRVVDGLLTNFHLPKSTLVMLVSALAGRERVLGLYAEAIERGYRFYSYGDAMLLLP